MADIKTILSRFQQVGDNKANWDTNKEKVLLANEIGIEWASGTGTSVDPYVGYGADENGLGGRPRLKVGDGVHTWAQLPYYDDVITDNFVLTYDFGRYTTSNGYVEVTDAVGMTPMEWINHALSVTEEPTITQPTASMSASFTPNSGETGTSITKINWDGNFTDGKYQYGSTENDTPNSGANTSVSWVVKDGDTQIGTSQDGSYAINLVMADTAVSKSLNSVATINVSNAYTPLNNVGAATTGKITGFDVNGTTTKSFTPTASVTGYRKMFVGNSTATTLDSAAIRALTLKSAQASTSAFEVTAPIGATNLIVACPTNSQGYNYTLSKAEMFTMSYEDYTDMFETKDQVDIADARGGENGLQAYNIYVYSFAALKAATKFRITLKRATA